MTHVGAYLSLLVSLLLASPLALAATPAEQANLELMVRQLNMLESLAKKSAAVEPAEGTRYHFDYERLQQDVKRVREGITAYMAPTRAQPRDPSQLTGHYTRTGSDKP